MQMKLEDYATYREITSQTIAWAQAIEVVNSTTLPDLSDFDYAVFTGCGSTYYLSIAVASMFQSLTGIPAKAVPASDLLFNSRSSLPQTNGRRTVKILLVAFSRSGSTSETIKAVEKFQFGNNGYVITISNYDEALSQLADISIVIPAGQEVSIAQTRSFASMYVAGILLCTWISSRNDLSILAPKIPEIGSRLLETYTGIAQQLGEDLDTEKFYFLGSGFQYGLACELSLKFKEMTLTHSEPFHFLEFRHGPMSMVDKRTAIVGFVSERNFRSEICVLSEMQALGGKTFTLGESGTDVQFLSSLPEELQGVLYLPVLQLTAFYRSLKKGLNPDSPKNLSAVVKLTL
jgi:glutamine---fructose-6-phosphate transaminase (isomerizing)